MLVNYEYSYNYSCVYTIPGQLEVALITVGAIGHVFADAGAEMLDNRSHQLRRLPVREKKRRKNGKTISQPETTLYTKARS